MILKPVLLFHRLTSLYRLQVDEAEDEQISAPRFSVVLVKQDLINSWDLYPEMILLCLFLLRSLECYSFL